MKKMKLMSALLALMLLLSAAMPSFAMTDAEWVWYLLRDYGGSNGKNGCYLLQSGGDRYFYAIQLDEESPKSARLRVEMEIQEDGDEVFIAVFAYIENANTETVRSDYQINELYFTIDGTIYYWWNLVNNDTSMVYTLTPGVIMLVPEIAFYQALKSAKNVSIEAYAKHYGNFEYFKIDDYDQCNNFKEFSKLVCDYKLHNYCTLGFMNAIAQVYPMNVRKSESAHYYYGQKLRVINCNSSISLRTNPWPEAERILMIPKGETVTFLENANNEFYKIEYDGWIGYASSLYLGK